MLLKKRFLLFGFITSFVLHAQGPFYDYSFFVNSRIPDFYFFSKVSSSLSSSISNTDQHLPISKSFVHTPRNALKMVYVNGIKIIYQRYREPLIAAEHALHVLVILKLQRNRVQMAKGFICNRRLNSQLCKRS